MKGLNFKSILCVSLLVLMLVTVVMMSVTMYSLANATPFTITPGTNVVTVDGVEAHEFWTDNKMWMIGPTVCNFVGMALVGILCIMG